MPSAAAKKKRAALRASQCKVSKDTGCRNETNLDDEVAKFNEEQHEFNERRRALLQRISERETQRCMQQISKAPPQVAQSRPSGAKSTSQQSDPVRAVLMAPSHTGKRRKPTDPVKAVKVRPSHTDKWYTCTQAQPKGVH